MEKDLFNSQILSPEKTGSQSGHGACGNQKSAEQMRYSPRIFAQAKILESLPVRSIVEVGSEAERRKLRRND